MISTFQFLTSWFQARANESEKGASLVEYALLVALIAVVCIIAVQILGEAASQTFSSAGTDISANTN